jgi:hypothetical protein
MIDWVESDHANHSLGSKLFDYKPGFPTLNLYKKFITHFLPENNINNPMIEDLTYNNIYKIFENKF